VIPAPDLQGELPPEVRFASGAIVVYQLAFLYRFEQGIELYTVTAIFKAAGVCMTGPRLIESLPPTERYSTSLSCGWYFGSTNYRVLGSRLPVGVDALHSQSDDGSGIVPFPAHALSFHAGIDHHGHGSFD
jgi:hypothetical protein